MAEPISFGLKPKKRKKKKDTVSFDIPTKKEPVSFGIPSVQKGKLGKPEQEIMGLRSTKALSTEATPAEVAQFLSKRGAVLKEVPPSLRDRADALKRTGHTILTDIFIRTESATVGAIEEIAKGTSAAVDPDARNPFETAVNAGSRVIRELFHGIPGVEGERKLFPEFLAEKFPEGPRASQVMPFLFHEQGTNGTLPQYHFGPEEGGALDVTLRDSIGLGLSIFGDFGTWVGLGPVVKGGRILKGGKEIGKISQLTKQGKVIAAQKAAETMSDAEKYALSLAGATRKTGDPLLDLVRTGQKRSLANVSTGSGQVPKAIIEGAEELSEAGIRAVKGGADLEGLSEKAMSTAGKVDLLSDQISMDAAHTMLANEVKKGAKGLIQPGGLTFAGKPIIPAEKFKVAQTRAARLLRHLEEVPAGQQVFRGLRRVHLAPAKVAGLTIKGIRGFTDGIDNLFAETSRAARKLPGLETSKMQTRAEIRAQDFSLKRGMDEMTRGWDKAEFLTERKPTFFGREVSPWEYVTLHLDDPSRFPVDPLPLVMRRQIPEIRRSWDNMWEIEQKRFGTEGYRKFYAPHYYENEFGDMKLLGTDYLSSRGGGGLTGELGVHGEMRAYPTFSDAMAHAAEKKARGGINFDLNPILDFREVFYRRAHGHIRALAADDFAARSLANLGVPKTIVDEKAFEMIWPEVKFTIDEAIERGVREAEPGVISVLPNGVFADTPRKVGDIFRKIEEGKAINLRGLSDSEKALVIMGQIRRTKNLNHLESILRRNADLIDDLDMRAVDRVRELAGKSREAAADAWDTPYGPVRLQKVDLRKLTRVETRGQAKKLREEGGGDMWVPVHLADEIERMQAQIGFMPKPIMRALKSFDLAQDWFKVGVTAYFPAFHFRNKYNNVMQAFIEHGVGAFDPTHAARVHHVLAGAEGTMDTPWGKVTHGQLRNEMVEYGVLNLDDSLIFEQRFTSPAKRRRFLDSKATRFVRSKGTAIENGDLASIYLLHRKRGMTPIESAWRARRVLFEYDALPPFEREVMRRIIPFRVWNRKNLTFTAEELPRRWGRYNSLLKFTDRTPGPEEDALPLYLRGTYKIGIQRDGGMTYITNIDTPLDAAMEQVFNGNVMDTLKGHMSSVAPVLRMFIELASGVQLFSGRSIRDRQHLGVIGASIKKMPEGWQKWLEFQVEERDGEEQYSINGTKAYILFKWNFLSRLFTTFNKVKKDTEFLNAAVNLATGMGIEELDADEAERNRMRNITREAQQILEEQGELRSGKFFFTPERPE